MIHLVDQSINKSHLFAKVTHGGLTEKPVKLIYCWSPILQ